MPSSEAVKLEAVARLLRQALRLAEGAEAAAHARAESEVTPAAGGTSGSASSLPGGGPTVAGAVVTGPPSSGSLAPHETSSARNTSVTPPSGEPGRPGPGGPPQVGYLLGLLQTEQARIDETKKEVARKDTELTLKLQFAKKKEEDLEAREGELKKLDAQLRVREMQITRREERMREMGRLSSSE